MNKNKVIIGQNKITRTTRGYNIETEKGKLHDLNLSDLIEENKNERRTQS